MRWPAWPITRPEWPTSPGSVRVGIPGGADYEVLVGRGLTAQLPALLRERCPAHRYAVIADHKVAELHGAALLATLTGAGLPVEVFDFPSGEWNKTREQWGAITDRLLTAGFGRDSAVLAFGGGVAGDLAGFVAATYLRGIPFVQVPTTLMAMIDSSIGGKTGVDAPAGKNLVGAFHQPRLVLADIEYLATLPRAHIAAGMAEAIKHGVIRDAAYLDSLDDAAACLGKDLDRLEAVVQRSVAIKAAVVAEDERESGVRAVLNFGHTVGHAVETLSGYDLLHGEAVAIGMVLAARTSALLGRAPAADTDRLAALLRMLGLPTALPAASSAEALLARMRLDKKNVSGRLRLVLWRGIGQAEIVPDADETAIRSVLE